MQTHPKHSRNPSLLAVVFFGLACFLTGVLSFTISFDTAIFPSVWLTSGVVFAIFLQNGYRRWLVLTLSGWISTLLAGMACNQSLLTSALIATATILAAAMGAWLVRRSHLFADLKAATNRLLSMILIAALASASTGAFISATIISTLYPTVGFLPIWQIACISHLIGIVSIVPIVLSWRQIRWKNVVKIQPDKWIEFSLLIVGLLATLLYIFVMPNERQNYLVVPFLVWAALRFGLQGVSVIGLLVTVGANVTVVNRLDGFAVTDAAIAPTMVNLGIFLLITLVTSHILAALWDGSRRIERALRQNEARYRLLVENQGEGIGIVDEQEVFTFANPAAAQIFGVAPGALIGRSLREFTTPEQFAAIQQQTILRKSNQKTTYEIEIKKVDGQTRTLLVVATPQIDPESGFTGTFAIFHDDTNRKQAEMILRDSRARYQTIFDHSPIPIWEEDFSRIKRLIDGLRRDGIENFREFFEQHPEQVNVCVQLLHIIDVNQAGMHAFDHVEKSKFFSQVSGVVHRGPSDVFIEELIAIAEGKQQFDFEGPNDIVDGQILYHHVRWTVAPGYEKDYRRVIVTITDVTERRQAEEHMRYLSTHDLLTGIYNRNFFEAELERLENSRIEPINVMVVDINGMKHTNDTLGHAAGDDLLRRAAQVLRLSFRKEDIIARIGGDEFVVLFHGNIPLDQTVSRVKSILLEHNHWYQGPPLSLAIGAATGNKESVLIDVFKKADKQMYREKIQQRN